MSPEASQIAIYIWITLPENRRVKKSFKYLDNDNIKKTTLIVNAASYINQEDLDGPKSLS